MQRGPVSRRRAVASYISKRDSRAFAQRFFLDRRCRCVDMGGRSMKLAVMDMHYLIAERGKNVGHHVDRHELATFKPKRILRAMTSAGRPAPEAAERAAPNGERRFWKALLKPHSYAVCRTQYFF